MNIYVAGPYTPKNSDTHAAVKEASTNVDNAIEVFVKLKEKGYTPFVPHLTHYIHVNPKAGEYGEWWIEYDLTFLEEWADGIYLMDGWEESKGAKIELKKAQELGLKVFIDLDEMVDLC